MGCVTVEWLIHNTNTQRWLCNPLSFMQISSSWFCNCNNGTNTQLTSDPVSLTGVTLDSCCQQDVLVAPSCLLQTFTGAQRSKVMGTSQKTLCPCECNIFVWANFFDFSKESLGLKDEQMRFRWQRSRSHNHCNYGYFTQMIHIYYVSW